MQVEIGWGDNSWTGKHAGIIGAGLNSAGTAVAQSHLRSILGYLGVTVVATPETCLPWNDDVLDHDHTRDRLAGFLNAFAAHVTTQARHTVPLPAPTLSGQTESSSGDAGDQMDASQGGGGEL